MATRPDNPDGPSPTLPTTQRRCSITSAWTGRTSQAGRVADPHALACAALLPERVIGTTTIASVAPYPAEGLDWMAGMGAENIEEFTAVLEGEASIRVFLDGAWPTFRDVSPESSRPGPGRSRR